MTWKLGGADEDDFTLTEPSATGVTVKLLARDYENPTDSDKNNTYEYTLTATDENENTKTTSTYTVTVNDVDEAPAKPYRFRRYCWGHESDPDLGRIPRTAL